MIRPAVLFDARLLTDSRSYKEYQTVRCNGFFDLRRPRVTLGQDVRIRVLNGVNGRPLASQVVDLFSCQYASDEFRQVLERFGIRPSMSRKGNCWENACSEALFASLKVERLQGRRFRTLRQARDETQDWLRWYNQTRLHSTLNYVTPMQFEEAWQGKGAATTTICVTGYGIGKAWLHECPLDKRE